MIASKKLQLFLGVVIPIAIIVVILILNVRPFGYKEQYTLIAGSTEDTFGELYLEGSETLSEKLISPDGKSYREFSHIAKVMFRPTWYLSTINIEAAVDGDNIEIISPRTTWKPGDITWTTHWNFEKEKPTDLIGSAFHFDRCTYFDGNSKLDLPESENIFETGPISIYASWKPESDYPFQQIIGNFSWELRQDRDAVTLQIGRMDHASGTTHFVRYPIQPEFFNKQHTALAIYNPSVNGGYMELYVDNIFAGRTYFGDSHIFPDYNEGFGLSFGKSFHTGSTFFKGCIYDVRIADYPVITHSNKTKFTTYEQENRLFLLSRGTSTLRSVILHVTK